jgi:plasmid stabilization system protein ParE
MLTILETKRAGRELEHIASQMISFKASISFVDQVHKTYERIAIVPTIGSLIEELIDTRFENYRRCTVKKFRNYIVIYSFNEDVLTIQRVFDGRRDYLELFENDE